MARRRWSPLEYFYICCVAVNLGGDHLLASFQVRPFTGRSSRNSVYAEMTQVTMHIAPDSPKYTVLWCPASLSCLENCTLLDTIFSCHRDDNLTNLKLVAQLDYLYFTTQTREKYCTAMR